MPGNLFIHKKSVLNKYLVCQIYLNLINLNNDWIIIARNTLKVQNIRYSSVFYINVLSAQAH